MNPMQKKKLPIGRSDEKTQANKVEEILESLVTGEIEKFESLLADMVQKVASFHDAKGP